jgi:hypothetical protein
VWYTLGFWKIRHWRFKIYNYSVIYSLKLAFLFETFSYSTKYSGDNTLMAHINSNLYHFSHDFIVLCYYGIAKEYMFHTKVTCLRCMFSYNNSSDQDFCMLVLLFSIFPTRKHDKSCIFSKHHFTQLQTLHQKVFVPTSQVWMVPIFILLVTEKMEWHAIYMQFH